MNFVILPNSIRDEINKKLDAAIKEHPDAKKDRDALFQMLLEYFDEHGAIPDFQLQKTD